MGFFSSAAHWLRNLSMLAKIAIGNSLVIVAGAVGGTLIARHYAAGTGDVWLILFFTVAGVAASILVNYWIVRAALRPLHTLRRLVDALFAEASGKGPLSLRPLPLAADDPDIRQLGAALNALITQLEANNAQLRALSQRVIHAQEEERKRIARTLHDDTGQALTMLIITLERMENQLPPSGEEIRARLATTRQLAADALEELRKTVRGLRPAILDDLGLAPAMRWYARSILGESGMQVEIEAPDEPIPMPSEMNTTLFRIAQEAVNNIQRHSGAKRASITLKHSGGEICLRIEDDGKGFQPPQTQGEAIRLRHWGLVNIQEWAELVGGTSSVSSEPGKGTLVEVTVPLPEPVEAANG